MQKRTKVWRLMAIDGRSGFLFLCLLCSFAGNEFPGVVMIGGTRYVYGFFCV
jgi:hypothetical protein